MSLLPDQAVILLIDGNPEHLGVLKQVLEGTGWLLSSANAGQAAIAQIRETQPDLILLNSTLSDLEGLEFCQQLQANPHTQSIPIILMSAVDSWSAQAALPAVVVDYLTLPLRPEEVSARVRLHLQMRSLSRELEAQNAQIEQLTEKLEHRMLECSTDLFWMMGEFNRVRLQQESCPGSPELKDVPPASQIEEILKLQGRAIAASSNGIVIVDARRSDYPTIFVNPAFEQITGYSAEEVLGRNCRFLQGKDTQQPGLQELRGVLTEGQSGIVTLRNYRKDGTLFWNELSIAPIYDEQSNLTHYIGIQTDVTERKLAEQQTQTIASRLTTLIQSLQAGILVEDEFRNIVVVNQAFCNLFHIPVPPETLIGMNCEQTAQQSKHLFQDPDHFLPRIQEILAGQKAVVGEVLYLVDERIFEFDYVPVFVDQIYRGHLWQYRDVTEREKSERSLKRQLAAVEAAIDGIAILGADDRYIYLNDAHVRLFGYETPADLIGRTWQELYQPEEIERFQREIFPVLGRDRHWQGEATARRRNGSTFAEEVSLTLIEGGGLVCVCRDITDRKIAEEQLKSSLQEKEILLKEIHHRVKNNLLVVSSLLDWQIDYLQDVAVIKIFEESQHRIQSMALIHEKLYRSENLAEINFSDYLETLARQLLFSFNLNDERIEFSVELEPVFLNIETATPCGLIVSELISNVFEHAFPDQSKGQLWLKVSANDRKQITITIKDNGVGFPDNLDFRNTQSLGLQLVCLLTQQLEGKIQMHQDNGTIFHLTFSELQYRKRL
ncbi:hypothetical protein BST81_12955 [Leptolyngbya sp. 'hensonii']|uniref:PAS domain S-box protein n=1 Tax=Leptolyngbya sp. 'hensonii' TaxID=1922337 RepID=UPI000950221C|nr:PAS domain S-box protein [Leptolyngbya sp. 'hensonii']OLP17956.1 hypothetical protein BST81_12955 [Leptolyngbya sp. 'hensonii']